MRSRRTFYTLVAVTVVMVAAAVVSQRPANEPATEPGLHAPGLGERVDAVQSVVIRTADDALELARGNDGWVARNKGDYPADAGRVRQLVLGLSRLQRLERKTDDPERLSRLELSAVEQKSSKAVRVTLLSQDGDTLADILVGKTRDFQQSGRSRYYVRDAGDPRSWLVEGVLPPVLEDAANWLQQALLPGVSKPELQSVRVTHADGEAVEIRRGPGEDAGFRLAGEQGDIEASRGDAVDAVAETLLGMSLQDVRLADSLQRREIAAVEAETFNGVRISARIGEGDPDYAVRLDAEYAPEWDRSGELESADPGAALAGRLDELWRGRTFTVSRYALDSLLVRRGDLRGSPQRGGEAQ